MSKNSKLKRKAIHADVHARAWYAFSSGVAANPYPVEDRRYDLFAAALVKIGDTDAWFEGVCEAHSCDTGQWKKRVHPDCGAIVGIDELVQSFLEAELLQVGLESA